VRLITLGLFVLGLIIGTAVGFFVRYYVVNPRRNQASEREQTSSEQETASDEEKPATALKADEGRIRDIMGHLSQQVGVRVEGTDAEREAAEYLKAELEKLGYSVGWLEFALPSGAVSRNLVTADPGSTDKYTFLIGASIDSQAGSPGANSNSSGSAAVLELARVLKGTDHFPEVRFLLFGASEGFGPKREPSYNGSRNYLESQPQSEQDKIVGMLSLDMIAVGPEMHFRDWGSNSPGLAQDLISAAQKKGINAYQNPSQAGDHAPFGMAGIPAVWLERRLAGGREDSKANTSSDDMAHVSSALVSETVDLLSGYALGLTEDYCGAAVAR
jgi:hypothetical protein